MCRACVCVAPGRVPGRTRLGPLAREPGWRSGDSQPVISASARSAAPVSDNHDGPFAVRYIRLEDVAAVVEIDKLSFPMPWSPRSYTFEISDNNAGHMIVIEIPAQPQTVNGLKGVIHRLRGQPAPPSTIVGYAGF